jgi:hypothetical protein
MSNNPSDQSLFAASVKAIGGIAALPGPTTRRFGQCFFGKLARLPIW